MRLHALRSVEGEDQRFDGMAVRRELDRLTEGSDPYHIRMWREALAEAAGLQRTPLSDQLVFPYVPFSPERFGLPLESTSRVLDVGCLAGYGLFDFSVRRLRLGRPVPMMCGIDVDRQSLALGRALAPTWTLPGQLTFQQARGEALPYPAGVFDLVIARSVLQYLRILPALRELARVVRRRGLVLIQVHAPSYYWQKLCKHLHEPLQAAYYGRALASGLLFSASRVQPGHRWFREAAITDRCLVSLCRSLGLRPLWSSQDACRPLGLFVKE